MSPDGIGERAFGPSYHGRQTETLNDSLARRIAQPTASISGPRQHTLEGLCQRRWIVRRHHLADVTHDGCRVADIGRDGGHAARHGFCHHVGEALGAGRQAKQVDGVVDPRHVSALAGPDQPVAEPEPTGLSDEFGAVGDRAVADDAVDAPRLPAPRRRVACGGFCKSLRSRAVMACW